MVLWLLSIAALVTFARWDGIPFYLVWLGFMLICGLVTVWHAYLGRYVDAERARANEENGRLLAIQRRFLQDASHQLKTPITIALGHAELLARELAGRGERRDVDVVVGELTRLKSLSERLLAIAASQDPEFLSPEPVPLDSFLTEVLWRWQPTARRGWKIGQLDAVTVHADRERLGLALDALLENAVQHTRPGDAIRLSVLHDEHAGSARLVVEDTGGGIMPADVDDVFERFRTGSAGGGSRGTGLGLALVRAVALGHGGDVRVRSALGAGSRFELTLPATARCGPYPGEISEAIPAWRPVGPGEAAMSGARPPAPRPRRVPGLRVPALRVPALRVPGLRVPGRSGRGKHPSTTVIVVAAACAGIVAAVIAIDSTAHHGTPASDPPAPAFTLPSLRDPAQQVSLSEYRGRPVIVNFFASWCGPASGKPRCWPVITAPRPARS